MPTAAINPPRSTLTPSAKQLSRWRFSAAWAIDKGVGELLLGSVATDGERHADGRPEFYRAIDELVSSQEGGIHVAAPGIGMTTAQLITAAGIAWGTARLSVISALHQYY